jgi:uncharacterized membrane protein YdbT with pleckstrin-like domain
MKDLIIKPSGIYAFGCVVHWLLLATLFAFAAWLLVPALILISVFFAAIGCYQFMACRMICYRLSEEILEVRTGILFRRTDHLELFRVKDYVMTQNLLSQVFGLMNLDLLTTDLSGPVLRLRGIPKSDIVEVIRERVQQARQHNHIVELN